jgi:uncharacterized protein YjbJ (UPF0337 family)
VLNDLDRELIARLRSTVGPEDSRAVEESLPYYLRKSALDRKLSAFELGRVLYHLIQRRGFKSNRKEGKKKKDDDLGKVKAGIGEKPRPIPQTVNSAQTSASHGATNEIALKAAIQALRGLRRNMTTSTEDKNKGRLREVKGAIKSEAGKVTNNPILEAKGKVEKNAGKVQHHVGDAESTVEELKK